MILPVYSLHFTIGIQSFAVKIQSGSGSLIQLQLVFHKFIRAHHLNLFSWVLIAQPIVIGNHRRAYLTLLGFDHDYPIGPSGAINRCRRCVFQYIY
ncbi:hypothetical protein D3C86_953810 [compost metagenome]